MRLPRLTVWRVKREKGILVRRTGTEKQGKFQFLKKKKIRGTEENLLPSTISRLQVLNKED